MKITKKITLKYELQNIVLSFIMMSIS